MIIFTKQFLTKATIFCCFDVRSVRPPHIFQVQAKISTARPMLPDYFSVSYDCDQRLGSYNFLSKKLIDVNKRFV